MSTFTQLSTVANPSHESGCRKNSGWKSLKKTKHKIQKLYSEHIVFNQQSKSNKQQNNKQKLITYSNKKNQLYPLKKHW
jgi:hypothetical protein